MNSLAVGLIGLFGLFLGYRFYARVIEKIWKVDPKRETPAYEYKDGVDYIPAKNWLVTVIGESPLN